jgi:hypothetical protein
MIDDLKAKEWNGNVKKVMKNQSGKQRKTSTSLTLEGGGKGWG